MNGIQLGFGKSTQEKIRVWIIQKEFRINPLAYAKNEPDLREIPRIWHKHDDCIAIYIAILYIILKRSRIMNIYKKINDNIERGTPFVLATIVKTAGHTPRFAGSKMLVYSDGSIDGTIGGGSFEKGVIEDCLTLFNSDSNVLLKSYKFDEAGTDSTGMICGGQAEVFMELFEVPNKLLVFGGGHVCRSLVEVMSPLDFKIYVIDNRPGILEYYNPPVKTILTDDNYEGDIPEIDQSTYIVIVTHGHQYDKEILARTIKQDSAYIGMIGSSKKIARTYAALESEGIEKSLFDKVHSPIGLDIGAGGPHEIAIAIAAEIIGVRRKSPIPRS